MSDPALKLPPMNPADISPRVIELRARGLTPKEIAKTLGVRRSEIEPLIRAHAEKASSAMELRVLGCWTSPGWSSGLRWDGHPEWRDGAYDEGREDGGSEAGLPRLASVLVARENRYGKVSVCGYLIDAHCLGVKDAIGPRIMDRVELRQFVSRYFSVYDGNPKEASLELAQALVLGALEFARGLGFEPHPDFEACRGHLGDWAGPSAIKFGFHGRPYFIPGPKDDVVAIRRTLERTVGRGNFECLLLGP